MASTPAPLPAIDITVPQWTAVHRARRRLDAVRSATGRITTGLGALAASVGLFTDQVNGPALAATGLLTGAGLATLRLWKPDGHQKATASALYVAPGASLAALLLAERLVPGPHWGEALALTVWTVGIGLLRPAQLGRSMLSTPIPAPPQPAAKVEPAPGHPIARWWATSVAASGGIAPGTLLEDITQTSPHCLRAVIRSAVVGEPVPEISVRRLSALMDVPESEIVVDGVPGRGAGVRRLTVGSEGNQGGDPMEVWAKTIAPVAMPGAVLTGVRVGRPDQAADPVSTSAILPDSKETT